MWGHHVTPGAAWPIFTAQFYVRSGWQARWAQREQGHTVLDVVHSYIYSKEVTSSSLSEQRISYEGQFGLQRILQWGQRNGCLCDTPAKIWHVNFSLLYWFRAGIFTVMRGEKFLPKLTAHHEIATVKCSVRTRAPPGGRFCVVFSFHWQNRWKRWRA